MSKRFWKGIFEENPVLVLMLGLCPALGTTTAVKPALAMGIATAIVLIAVELVMTLLSHAVHEKVFMVVSVLLTAVLTSIAEYVMAQNFPELHEELGIYLPLMAISSVILSRVSAVSKSGSLAEALGDSWLCTGTCYCQFGERAPWSGNLVRPAGDAGRIPAGCCILHGTRSIFYSCVSRSRDECQGPQEGFRDRQGG